MGKLAPNRARAWVAVAVCAALALSVAGGVAWGKYVYSQQGDQAVRAKEFYFTSNLLTEAGNNVTLAPGTQEIEFTIGNHADDLRFSEDEIPYTVTVKDVTNGEGSTSAAVATTNGEGSDSAAGAAASGEGSTGAAGAAASGEGSTSAELSPDSGILAPGKLVDDTIRLSKLENGHKYLVTATTQDTYAATLTCTITVQSEDLAVYKHVDTSNSAYVLLTVWTKDYTGSVKITYPTSVAPDNTDSVMRTWQNAVADDGTATATDSATFAATTSPSTDAQGYRSHTYRFFKTSSGVQLDTSSFTVTYAAANGGSTEAAEKQIS